MTSALRAGDLSIESLENDASSPATRAASRKQRQTAFRICTILVLITLALLPIAQTQWAKIPAFLPMYQTAVIVTYLITAYLMYGHYSSTKAEALLHLSAGCLYTTGILVLQFLSFPGAFVADRPLIGGSQTTIWLWFFWHAGPAVGILLYAWSEYRYPGRRSEDLKQAVVRTAGVLFATFLATLLLVTTFHDTLPVLDIKGDFSRITRSGVAPALQVLLLGSLVLLWKASRFRKVLHVWLAIALVALLCDNAITMAGANRLSLGWYVGRFSALVSSATMMIVYLHEIKNSYQRSVATADSLAMSYARLEVVADAARLDSPTKLAGRELFMERAETMRAESVANGMGFATLFIDLDGFKAINDGFGHEHGDWVLVRVAQILKAVLRTDDVVGRMGGDEFVACMSGPKELSMRIAQKISERIVDEIAKIGNGIGASVGISHFDASVETALHQADEAMYEAKRLGKNRTNQFRLKRQLVAVVA